MSERYDVILVGGGLVGPLLSIALAGQGLRVAVIDALPMADRRAADFDGRAYALSASSIRLLDVLGLWSEMRGKAQPIKEIKVSDGRPGEGASPFFLHFDHREIEDGPFGHLLEDRFLRGALLDGMERAGVDHLADTRVTAMETGKVSLAGAAGADHLAASLIVGCDGRRSKVAEWAGITRRRRDYQQTSLVAAVEHERPHQATAHQFFTPAGPLAILPLPGNRSSIVWTEGRARAEEIMARDDAGYLDALRPVFGDFLGEISLVGARFTYPLSLSLASSLVGYRVALAGDSGHGIHPLAGQGLNLGIRDVAALAEVLIDAVRRGEDIGAPDVLARYAQWRRFDIAAMAMATDGINTLFSNDNPILRGVRDLGMGLVSALPGARRAFMREAAGLTGDRPRLLCGKSL